MYSCKGWHINVERLLRLISLDACKASVLFLCVGLHFQIISYSDPIDVGVYDSEIGDSAIEIPNNPSLCTALLPHPLLSHCLQH
jgi:hypothetical protein